jgi:hypothetical protein
MGVSAEVLPADRGAGETCGSSAAAERVGRVMMKLKIDVETEGRTKMELARKVEVE